MDEFLIEEINRQYPNKGFLTIEEVASLLDCSKDVIYNWTKRTDPKKRPPRIRVGSSVRFPKMQLAKWLAIEQATEG
jgi:excisionase family DNA binding protein